MWTGLAVESHLPPYTLCRLVLLMHIAVLYAVFAVISTVFNIAVQDCVLRMYDGPGHLWASVIFGTGTGLLAKYLLDKRYIFRFRPHDAAHDARTFTLYVAMGLLTTAIFWGCEFAFHAWFGGAPAMRYLGGAIGLAIGYTAKYHLDKRYVFIKAAP